MLFSFGSVAYFQQKSLTVAAERIMPELHLSQMQIGWLQWAFLLGYTTFQFPGGLFGQRVGARRGLLLLGGLGFVATLVPPLAPALWTGAVLFAVLLAAQFTLGLAQAPLFPIAAGVQQAWFPCRLWGTMNGLQPLGVHLGAALAPPVIVLLTRALGWQRALSLSALPALGLLGLWAWYARDSPREHPGVSSAEIAELGDEPGATLASRPTLRHFMHLLSRRDLLLLTLSYCSMNYVFYLISNWSFLYLVQQRRFTVLESGWLATLPPLGAALGAGLGGKITDSLCARLGLCWGHRLVPLLALPAAGALLLLAIHAENPYGAVAALALCFACVELTEGSYWAAVTHMARADTMAATGVLNTGGNLGGLIGIPIIAYFSGHGAWHAAFVIGTFFILGSALLWLGADASRRIGEAE